MGRTKNSKNKKKEVQVIEQLEEVLNLTEEQAIQDDNLQESNDINIDDYVDDNGCISDIFKKTILDEEEIKNIDDLDVDSIDYIIKTTDLEKIDKEQFYKFISIYREYPDLQLKTFWDFSIMFRYFLDGQNININNITSRNVLKFINLMQNYNITEIKKELKISS